MAQQKDQFAATPNAINIFSLNPGLNFTADQLQAINAGTLVVVGPAIGRTGAVLKRFGCIKSLRYQENDEDLVYVEFDSGAVLAVPPTFPGNAANLNDFRKVFEEAACCGYGVSACQDTQKRRIFMVNVLPCECTCDKRDQPTFPGQTVVPGGVVVP